MRSLVFNSTPCGPLEVLDGPPFLKDLQWIQNGQSESVSRRPCRSPLNEKHTEHASHVKPSNAYSDHKLLLGAAGVTKILKYIRTFFCEQYASCEK